MLSASLNKIFPSFLLFTGSVRTLTGHRQAYVNTSPSPDTVWNHLEILFCFSGVFTCGPVSVKAIRNGELYFGSDARFLFAEVNGSRIHWTVDTDGNMTPFQTECDVVGKNVSTKAAGTISREDLTSAYKHKAGKVVVFLIPYVYIVFLLFLYRSLNEFTLLDIYLPKA